MNWLNPNKFIKLIINCCLLMGAKDKKQDVSDQSSEEDYDG